ncbi:MAG: STAS domain-containing protein [Mycobacterium sp.]
MNAAAELSIGVQGSVIVLSGELELATATRLQATVEDLRGSHRDLRIDGSGLTFCDSTGIRTLIWAHNTLSAGGEPVLINPSRHLAALITLTGLGPLLLGRDPAGPKCQAPAAPGPPALQQPTAQPRPMTPR